MGHGLSVMGALAAAVSGFVTACGYGLMTDPEAPSKQAIKRGAGGAIFVFGLYLWSPTAMRKSWWENV